MSDEPRTPRRRYRWAAAALVVVVLAAAVVIATRVFTTGPGSDEAGPEPTLPQQSAAPGEPGDEPAVTGCLGGESRDAAMVQAAQDAADRTPGGAVEVAAAFVRFLNQYPYPAGVEQVQASAISATAPTRDLVAFFATEPDLSGGLVEAGQPYWLSTVSGVYVVEEEASDVVTASIGTALVRDGELSPTLKGSITVTVSWEDGHWVFVRSAGTRTTEDLFAVGTPFSGGC
jgi:hypothetical protein